jgi:hypothetical protein
MVQKSVKKGNKKAKRVELGIETMGEMRMKCKVKGI